MKKNYLIIACLGLIVVILFIAYFTLYFKVSGSGGGGSPAAIIKPSPTQKVDDLLREMEFGVIAFNSPKTINIEESSKIQLLLSLTDTVEELKKLVKEEGQKIGVKVKISDKMTAKLVGNMFEITPITPELQVVSNTEITEWNWEIHPKKVGVHWLYLSLTANLEIEGTNATRSIKTFHAKIEVKVTPYQKVYYFFEKNWQWLFSTLLIPIAIYIWRKNINKKS